MQKRYIILDQKLGVSYECILRRYKYGHVYIGKDVVTHKPFHCTKAIVDRTEHYKVGVLDEL